MRIQNMPNSHVIQYLDNECSVQIPAEFLEQLGIQAGECVELTCRDDAITLVKAGSPDSGAGDASL